MCVECASKETEHLDRGVITESKGVAATIDPDLESIQASTKVINYVMDLFLVKPTGLKGNEIFSHMDGVCIKNNKTTSPSELPDTAVITSTRSVLKDETDAYTRKNNIMKDSGGSNARIKLGAIKG